MTREDWDNDFDKSIAVFLNGKALPEPNRRGERIVDDSFLLCFNAHDQEVTFIMPPGDYAQAVDGRTGHHQPDRHRRAGR